ncbi:MAG: hypothetical protein LBF72_01175 [Holosporales bacterium]|nr:hypothetical protein [Holosporales bacterium]
MFPMCRPLLFSFENTRSYGAHIFENHLSLYSVTERIVGRRNGAQAKSCVHVLLLPKWIGEHANFRGLGIHVRLLLI